MFHMPSHADRCFALLIHAPPVTTCNPCTSSIIPDTCHQSSGAMSALNVMMMSFAITHGLPTQIWFNVVPFCIASSKIKKKKKKNQISYFKIRKKKKKKKKGRKLVVTIEKKNNSKFEKKMVLARDLSFNTMLKSNGSNLISKYALIDEDFPSLINCTTQ
jgi:type III secretory pathway component EscV